MSETVTEARDRDQPKQVSRPRPGPGFLVELETKISSQAHLVEIEIVSVSYLGFLVTSRLKLKLKDSLKLEPALGLSHHSSQAHCTFFQANVTFNPYGTRTQIVHCLSKQKRTQTGDHLP